MNANIAELVFNVLHPLRFPGGLAGATEEQRSDAASAARGLIAWSTETSPNHILLRLGAEIVLDTIDADVVAGVGTIESLLTADLVRSVGYEVLPAVCRRAERLVGRAPVLLERIYSIAFQREEEIDDGQANFGGSQILAFTMSKRQMFDDAPRALTELYPAFVAAHPREAMRVLASVLERYVDDKDAQRDVLHRRRGAQPAARTAESVTFLGQLRRFEPDLSHIWGDAGVYQGDNARVLLDHWERWLDDQAQRGADISAHVAFMLEHTGLAVVWNRIIRIARISPRSIHGCLELLTSPVLLLAADVRDEVGELMGAVHANEPSSRSAIEQALLRLPLSAGQDGHQWAARVRRVFVQKIVSPETNELRAVKVAAQADAPLPSAGVRTVDETDVYETDYVTSQLVDAGVPLEEPGAAALAADVRALRTYAAHARNERAVDANDAEELLTRVVPIEAIFSDAGKHHAAQLNDARRAVADALNIAAHAKGLEDKPAVVKELARLSLSHCADLDDGEENKGFHSTEASEAASAVMLLCRFDDVLNDDVRDALQRCMKSPSESVRHSVSRFAYIIVRRDDALGWTLLDALALDKSDLVVRGLLHSLDQLSRSAAARVHGQLERIILERNNGDGVLDEATTLLAITFVYLGHPAAGSLLVALVDSFPGGCAAGVPRVSHHARIALERTRAESTTTDVEKNKRAWEVLTRLATRARELWDAAIARVERSEAEPLTDQERDRIRTTMEFMDNIASQLHFGSGAFQGARSEAVGPELHGDELLQAKRKYFERSTTAVRALTLPIHPRTAHSIVEMLAYVSDGSPRDVFLAMRDVVCAAGERGYGNERMALDKVVGFVKHYLAEHRNLLQQDAECRVAMEQLLSVFVTCGWRNAMLLVKELDAVFR